MWRRASFKEQSVWAEVDAEGQPLVSRGRVRIRYKLEKAAKVYNAGASRVVVDARAPLEPLGGKPSKPAAPPVDLEGAIVAYTDGACSGNPGPAGSGARVELLDGRVAEASRSLGVATNNIAELTAIGMAVEILDEEGVPNDAVVALHTDSKYAIGVLTLGWKAKANRELILGLRDLLAKWPGVRLIWVKGHAGHDGNERADELARVGATGVDRLSWST